MTQRDVLQLHHVFEGPEDAPVLVMSNSLGTTLRMWEDQATALRERFRLLRYDHRGHGGSPVPPDPYHLEDLGRDLLALLDASGIERVSLCGLSLGGMVGMWLASEAPERVERLALCCTSARLGPPEQWSSRARAVREGGMEAVADTVLERWFTPAFRSERPDTVEWAREMLLGTPPEGYAGCCEAIRDMDLRERLGEIDAPTLIIAGADDPATPPEHAQLIHDSIPGSRLEVIPDAAHLANVERPEVLTRALLDHLAPVAEGRRAR
jgi:3-oxoadipate enol-lactonase